ncbi:MarR family winged helix-turn-helix transcriptional regulator [Actinoalloteichus hymeniacidonis]|uniref:Transcriptional regulator n=1 Tax=Actinoalloteichus hymeniacidonis TaxID=340345 RepID=A0AAC9HMG8_9PSEU|nr:MarR family winged helix-turn-helix transcriptional regulator [Actinoalloteichus hymeniacidonis]AOS62022.1 transcriptional regulator [Actinoalloteichus hymeniacidonis]MBB5909956.1 DNA-binding MarR family transcriptional regulator [Actinoalloteichus hymeniacidonis]
MEEAPQPADDTERSGRILDGLRAFGANYTEFTDRFAAWLGLHSTDARALVEILYAEDKGTPLSPTRLSERLALTTGATTNLLNRLERLGHIVRTREQADRRAVTLRSSKEIEAPAREFFGPLAVHLDALVAQYPPEQLDQFERFLDGLRVSMNELLAEQAEASGRSEGKP